MTVETSAAYLYCIVRSAARPSVARAPRGVPGGAKPEPHRVGPSLWLITAAVPLEVYGPDALEPRLKDLDWVSRAALAHEAIVEHFSGARGTTVIPMKLFTMFSTVERAVADVEARRDTIARALRRIAGAEEWGVRVVRRQPVRSAARVTKAATGAEFLRSRKQARDAVADAREAIAAAADRAFGSLRRLARDTRVRDARREPGTNPPVLDAAFLVASRSRSRFKTEARRQARALAASGADLVLSGPWPAYNFVAGGDSA